MKKHTNIIITAAASLLIVTLAGREFIKNHKKEHNDKTSINVSENTCEDIPDTSISDTSISDTSVADTNTPDTSTSETDILNQTYENNKEQFFISEIPDDIFEKMQGKSYKADCTLPRENLRYIVRELSRMPSNFRCEGTIQDFLEKNDIPGVAGIDTRALTKILREKGTMNGMITTNENYNLDEIIPKLKAYTTGNVVDKVTCTEKKVLKGQGKRVALMDFGAKNNIAKSLNERGCEVTIYPAHTTAEEILGDNPDGIMLSNGPGDPKECVDIIKEIKKLYDSNVPIFAICLGHQLMALATGADTHKMKYGHRGGNHPVKDLATGRVYISSQNHGYVVDTDKLDPNVAEPAFINVNDGTNEGLKYVNKNIFTVQFHPEACPGPQDSAYLFDRFINMMGGNQ